MFKYQILLKHLLLKMFQKSLKFEHQKEKDSGRQKKKRKYRQHPNSIRMQKTNLLC